LDCLPTAKLIWQANINKYIHLPFEAEARIKIFKNSVRTSKRTPHFTITKINWLTLFKEIIAVYTENHTEPKISNAELPIVKAAGTSSYHSASKG
jgi:hypothetical protein